MTTAGPVRVALLGLGLAGGRLLLPALRRTPGVEVAAACDPDERTHVLAGRVATFTRWREALDSGVDAVVVATPPETHFELAAAALEEGKHVYVEKPMTTSLSDATDLVRRREASGRVLQVGFAFRFHPLWQRVRGLLDRGSLGRPFSARARFAADRQGAGWAMPLIHVGCHHLDLISWLAGAPPRELRAIADGRLEARWDDGTSLAGEYVAGPKVDRMELDDGQAALVVDRIRRTRLLARGLRLGRSGWPDPALVRAHLTRSGWERSYERALRAFAEATRDGRPRGPGPEEGTWTVAAGEATLRSLESGAFERLELPSAGARP